MARKRIPLISIVALIIALVTVAACVGTNEAEKVPGKVVTPPAVTEPATKTPTLDDMKALAVEIASAIDGDTMAAPKPGDETTPEYAAIHDQLVAFREANPWVTYVYTMRKTENVTEFVVDADYGTGDADACAIGEIYSPTEEDTVFLAGFEEPAAEIDVTVYGYAPIKDASGASVGLVCLVPGVPIAQSDLEALAAEIASAIDGDAHAALKPGDEDTPEYTAIRDQLVAFREENPEISGIYTMRNAGDITEYVVDADYGTGDGWAIGDIYTPTALDTALLAGFEEPSAEIYAYVYGYAPIKNASGAGVGAVILEARIPITQERVKALAVEIAGEIDGDAMAALKPGDEGTPEYIAISDRLEAFRKENLGVIYVYTMRKAGDVAEYVVDADYDRAESAKIGDVYVPNESDVALLAGFTEPSVEPGFYLDDWGNRTATVISGYAPVKSSDGTIVGLVGVDLGILH